ncbi:MAG: hypothetical protein HZB56_09890 [Deltaproteobacteria bacterium]|nr:hypothetical protein [Deltaproteobacteria bacterium]
MIRDAELLPLLATLLLPAAAERLLALGPPGPAGPDDGAALRSEGRVALLRRLSHASTPPWPDQRRRAADAAAQERARLAALIQRLADGAAPPPDVAPFLLRLLRERLATDAPRHLTPAERTRARAADGAPRACPRGQEPSRRHDR